MSILDYFSKLYKERRELAMLEWIYLGMVIVSVVVAGICALVDQSVGVGLLIIPLVAFIAMSMNVVAWALIKLAADTILKRPGSRKTAKKK